MGIERLFGFDVHDMSGPGDPRERGPRELGDHHLGGALVGLVFFSHHDQSPGRDVPPEMGALERYLPDRPVGALNSRAQVPAARGHPLAQGS